ncbi:MAG: NIL domain-containing protein [Planctomycetota bacterium]
MLVKHRLELAFQPSHVQEPLTCEMTRRFKSVMFNVDDLSVGIDTASMRLSLLGKPPDVKKAKDYLRSLNVDLKTLSAYQSKAKIPKVPIRPKEAAPSGDVVQRKLWLTFLGAQKKQPFLWTISRRFNVTYKITQSTIGGNVAIMSLMLWGAPEEVDAVVSYLRDQGINVEFGELGLSAPFGPE